MDHSSGAGVKVERRRRGRTISLLFAAVVVAAVIGVSFLPSKDKHLLHTRGRYHSWGHLIVFVAVSFAVVRASSTLLARILLFLGALILGFAIEYGEHLIFMAPVEWKDIAVDGLGVLLGTVLASVATLVGPVEERN